MDTASKGKQAPLLIDCPWLYSNIQNKNNLYSMNNFFDVIIIGFGPTGGTLASLLAKSNLSILTVREGKNLYPLPRAVHFDDEVREYSRLLVLKKI